MLLEHLETVRDADIRVRVSINNEIEVCELDGGTSSLASSQKTDQKFGLVILHLDSVSSRMKVLSDRLSKGCIVLDAVSNAKEDGFAAGLDESLTWASFS